MVFQSYAVWPHMTVFENAAFPLRVGRAKLSRSVVDEKVRAALDLVGLGGFERRMATQLSGGQQQRLSLARALVREPSVLLLDEPLSNLDAKLRERMRRELLLIQKRVGITTLFVTHDQVEALSMSDRIAIMDRGRIVQEGSAREIYHHPANEFVVSFVGSVNLLPATVRGAGPAGETFVVASMGEIVCVNPSACGPGSNVIVAIRPEDVVLHRGGRHSGADLERANVFEGQVSTSMFGGTSVDYHVNVGDGTIHARVASRIELRPGDPVHVELPLEATRIFLVDDPRLVAVATVEDIGRTARLA
jgi:iron(III) transport system ATP-binding protein